MTTLDIIRGTSLNHNETLVRDRAMQHQQVQTMQFRGDSLNHNETLVRDQVA